MTTSEPSLAIRLYGTEEAVDPPRVLRVGDLEVEFEAGNLRYLRFQGHELLRAVSFIVRDRNWGTYNPVIENLDIAETANGFDIGYDATVGGGGQELRYKAKITGDHTGEVTFEASYVAVTDFDTNRTGFVVLHAGEKVAGQVVSIERVDGSFVDECFPEQIDPVQPMMDLRALTHEAAPGLSVTCRMEGDTFEMEDQRNWTDASFKTYVRPLALPWPYRLEAGLRGVQKVTVSLSGRAGTPADSGATISLRVGDEVGTVPALGLGLHPDDADDALANTAVLKLISPGHLVCRHDPRAGHDRHTLEKALAVARAIGAVPWLEAVVASIEQPEAEIADLGALNEALGSPFGTVLLSPAPDLKCTLPGSPWPPCPPLDTLYEAARRAFPQARIGGGMFSYFTELNRKRPPREHLDLVGFTTAAVVHAGDDRSVLEGLSALPFIATSARAICGEEPFSVGPSAIGMRENPYGEAPLPNPDNIRQAMNFNDPRQRGLLGAAWNLGYFAHFAYGGAQAVTLGGCVGAFGVLHVSRPWPQPWFDANGGLYPVFHVLRGLASHAGSALLAIENTAPALVQAVAVRSGEALEIWIANLSADPQTVAVPELGAARVAVVDSGSFATGAAQPDMMDHGQMLEAGMITLDSFSVVRMREVSRHN